MAAVGFLSPARGPFAHSHRRQIQAEASPSTPPARQLFFRLRCSSEAAAAEAIAAEDGAPPPGTESPVGTAKKIPSLISAANVQKALRGIEITNVDYYGRLGIARGDSYDEVNIAYEKKCEELINQRLDEEEANKRLDLLKESYAILSSEEERRLYDWSLARNEMPGRYVWPFEVDITQTPTQPPPPPEPEDIGPTRLVGYFFLAWFLLSVVLSVALNR
uniref:Chaperone DnaJ-domain superfamily protein n=1 Tax=Cypripedium formosanum TaxID=53042 RepID=A0A0F7H092_9ASPA